MDDIRSLVDLGIPIPKTIPLFPQAAKFMGNKRNNSNFNIMDKPLLSMLKVLISRLFVKDSSTIDSERDSKSSFNPLGSSNFSKKQLASESISEGKESVVAKPIPPTIRKKPNCLLNSQEAPLLTAISSNNIQQCKKLLKNSESLFINKAHGPEKKTLLHLACARGYTEICELLLDYANNLDINPRDRYLKTPLHLACEQGRLYIVKLLIRSGAELNAQDLQKNSPIHLASLNGALQTVEWLLTRLPDVLLENSEGSTPIMLSPSQEMQFLFENFLRKYRKGVESAYKKVSISVKPLPIQTATALDFDIIKPLGKGSFGEVYLVRNKQTQKLYAMKSLDKSQIFNKKLVRYAIAERNILSHLKHPFIVSLKYAFQTSKKLLLILDYCAGGDLGKHLKKRKRFPEWLAKIYICEIILALEELHKNNIIFRDLKPENIILDSDGHARLIDFGLSKEEVSDSTITRSFCGSLAYLAPEIIQRKGHGQTVDWYLLGVLFYETLVGVPPFYSSNRKKLFRNILYGRLKLPSSISCEAKDLLKLLLRRAPAERLGAKDDAAEVKAHSYFEGINWDQVLRKELKPVLPDTPNEVQGHLPTKAVYGTFSNEEDKLIGWTFVSD